VNDKKIKYIVIRVSNVDTHNVVEELDKVLAQRGHVWFGKYGRVIRGISTADQPDYRLVLVQRRISQAASYTAKTYRITGYSRLRPKDQAYPEYYKDVIQKIRTWVKIELAPQYEHVLTEDLVVISSASPLAFSLKNSMSSNFTCRLRDDRVILS